MKAISIAVAKANMNAVLDSAQRERVLITRNGKPSVVIVGVEAYDAEDFELANSSEFWRMIEERRREPSIPWSEAKAQLGVSRRRKPRPARSSIPMAEVKARLAARERAAKSRAAKSRKNGRKKKDAL